MVRTQIQLTEEQAGALKRLAAERGVSMATLIREGVDRVLDGEGRAGLWERAIGAVGMGDAGEPGRASEEHDEHLSEAYLE